MRGGWTCCLLIYIQLYTESLCHNMNHQNNKAIGMEGQQQWRPRLSFRSATIMMCLLNLFTALLLLQGFMSSASSRSKSSHTSGPFLSLSLYNLAPGYCLSLQNLMTHHLGFAKFVTFLGVVGSIKSFGFCV